MVNIDGMKKEDLVSIIMPAYNCGDFIGMTLDSVINQSYKLGSYCGR